MVVIDTCGCVDGSGSKGGSGWVFVVLVGVSVGVMVVGGVLIWV